MKRHFLWPSLVFLLLLLTLGGLLLFRQSYVILGEQLYPRETEVLDFSGSPLPNLETLTQFNNLKQLDLRDTGLTISQYDQLAKSLPDCDIQWLVPFQDSYLPLDTETVTVTAFTDGDIPALQHLTSLKTVKVIDFGDAEQIAYLKTALPGCKILQQYTFGDTLVDENTLFYKGTNIKDITMVLSLFPNISLIDATGCPYYGALAALKEQYPKCRILYEVPVGGILWGERSTEIIVDSTTAYELSLALPALPRVKSVQVTQPIYDAGLMLQLRQKYPQIDFSYSFEICGKTVTPETEVINISGVKLESVEDFEKYIPHFKNLKKVDMCGCGISNEDMDALKQRYPDIFFVWKVQIGHAWIRTDVTYFMPYKHRLVLYDKHVDNLKYLTELICLDMGHMKVTRTDYLAYMPKLQYLLMCSTPITDISYCANMKDLKYVELFLTKVTDFSPLLECKNLVDLNVCYTNPDDPLIFAQMTQLQNLWFRNMMDWQVRSQLRQALPNTTMVFDPGSSTGGGWRKLPNYYAQRDILRMPYMDED